MQHPDDPTQIITPFTDDEVARLTRLQHTSVFHGYTCGGDHVEYQLLVATVDGWRCPDSTCPYEQYWAHVPPTDSDLDAMRDGLGKLIADMRSVE